MGKYTIFYRFENPRRGRQARNFTTNVPKILDLKSSSEQIFSENCRWVSLTFVFYESSQGSCSQWLKEISGPQPARARAFEPNIYLIIIKI